MCEVMELTDKQKTYLHFELVNQPEEIKEIIETYQEIAEGFEDHMEEVSEVSERLELAEELLSDSIFIIKTLLEKNPDDIPDVVRIVNDHEIGNYAGTELWVNYADDGNQIHRQLEDLRNFLKKSTFLKK